MFVSYVCIPIMILTVISGLFSFLYYRMARSRILDFENSIAENAENECKKVLDNLMKSAAQYSMTPWVERLKYMQKKPELLNKNITASDISDYASTLSLTEINDTIVEAIYIYFSIGEFGISSLGRVGWQEYVDVMQISCQDMAFLSGSILNQNNQRVIYHNVNMMKNGKRMRGFCLIQTIPLENSYSGETNILFFVPYENIHSFLESFLDDGTKYLYLTNGRQVIHADEQEKQMFQIGDSVDTYKTEGGRFCYFEDKKSYLAQYTKPGIHFGILQVLDNEFLNRDFYAFIEWMIMGYLLLLGLIFFVSNRLANVTYQPLEHIMDMLEKDELGEGINEYQLIEKALGELDSQKQRLEVTVFRQNPLIEQYILHTLLISNRPQSNEVKYINTMRKYSLYRALVLKGGAEARQYMKEIDSCLAIYPQIHAAYVEEDGYCIWVLSYGDEGLVEEIVELLTQTFADFEYTGIGLGMSRIHEDILHLLSAYNQAVRALEYHFFYPDKMIMLFEENGIERREQSCEEFEVTEEAWENIADAVENMDAERLFQEYTAVLGVNLKEHILHKEAFMAGIHRLNDRIRKAFAEKRSGSMLEQAELPEPENFGSLDSYLNFFQKKVKTMTELRSGRENPLYYSRNQIIRQYVEEHLTDAELSLNETARVMHYTSTYFGKYFKEQFGCTFQKYVAVKRIECAKEYLRQGDNGRQISMQEIALKCGFTNDVTFRRTFKMYVGVTPSQFEKEQIM